MSTSKPEEEAPPDVEADKPDEEASLDAEAEALAQAQAEDAPDEALDGVEPADIDARGESEASPETLQARAGRLDAGEAARIVESLLFVSDKPLTLAAIKKACGLKAEAAEAALHAIGARYQAAHGGIVLHEVGEGWQLRSAPESAEYVRRLLQVKPQRLTRAALETLAIVAYRQPITRPEIEEVRAVDSGAILKALLERKLVKILGKKEEPGHPLLYGTTREFLEFFNLKDLSSLPTLREFQELTEESREIVEKETGAPIEGTVAQLADESFVARQRERVEASEQALGELEQAMSDAETQAQKTEKVLAPEPAEAPPGEAPGEP